MKGLSDMKDLTKKRRVIFCLTAGLIITHTATAIENPAGLPPELAPEITIIDNGHRLVEEYRANGRIFMIKINPKKGPAYYLVDADGDGNFDTQKSDLSPNLLIPSWVLFSWK